VLASPSDANEAAGSTAGSRLVESAASRGGGVVVRP